MFIVLTQTSVVLTTIIYNVLYIHNITFKLDYFDQNFNVGFNAGVLNIFSLNEQFSVIILPSFYH